MRLIVTAVGHLKLGSERELATRYAERASRIGRALALGPVEVVEIPESRHPDVGRRKRDEGTALLGTCPADSLRVALDERGSNLASPAFAAKLAHWRDEGRGTCCFFVGGPDGLSPELRDGAEEVLAFGAATWPHQLVRIMLLEQIYRAVTILSGHPYHRP